MVNKRRKSIFWVILDLHKDLKTTINSWGTLKASLHFTFSSNLVKNDRFLNEIDSDEPKLIFFIDLGTFWGGEHENR